MASAPPASPQDCPVDGWMDGWPLGISGKSAEGEEAEQQHPIIYLLRESICGEIIRALLKRKRSLNNYPK